MIKHTERLCGVNKP